MSFSLVKIGEIAEVAAGGGAPQSASAFNNKGTPFIRAGSLNSLVNGALESTLEHLTDGVANEHGLRKFPPDTVVFAKSGMSATKGHIYRLRNEAYVVNHLAAIIPSERVVPAFLEHSLRVFSPVRLIQDAAYPSIRLGDVSTMHIPLPSLAEQWRIAEILDLTRALRAKRRVALTQLDSLTQSIFLDLFGDPATNPKRWPMLKMENLFSSSPIFGTMIPPSIEGGTWLSLRVANIQDWQLDLTDQKFVELPASTVERHSVKNGDVLLARAIASQEHLGKAVVVYPNGRQWAFDSHLMRLRFNPDRAEPEFVRSLLMTPGGRRLFLKVTRRSVVQFNINTKEIAGLHIPLPPAHLQREFVHRRASVEKLKEAQRASLIEMDALFNSLQHRAFRGEL